jgi:prepilin-type N-terminal cleavage/methylation domain-containing protein
MTPRAHNLTPARRPTLRRSVRCAAVGHPAGRGFTLVELIVALLIIALMLMLVSGVGRNVLEASRSDATRNIQTVIMDAVKVYYRAEKDYPPGDGGPDSSETLLAALRAVDPSRPILRMLPADAVQTGPMGDELLYDGFGRAIRYDRSGGLAGRRPLLTSPGPENDDTTDDIISDY